MVHQKERAAGKAHLQEAQAAATVEEETVTTAVGTTEVATIEVVQVEGAIKNQKALKTNE